DSGETLSADKVTDPQYGTLTLNSDGSLSYQHGGSENHRDSFSYKVKDSSVAQSESKTVTITMTPVEDAQQTNAAASTTKEDTHNT
ncbi:hypothetical protein CWB96_22855, partial [Pseudoalteromonas citrea]